MAQKTHEKTGIKSKQMGKMNKQQIAAHQEAMRQLPADRFIVSLHDQEGWLSNPGIYDTEQARELVGEHIKEYHQHLLNNNLVINKPLSDLMSRLVMEGGQIVCTSQLTKIQITIAAAQDRMAVDAYGIGYVWFPTARFKEQEEG